MWPLQPEVELSHYFVEQALIILALSAFAYLIVRSERRSVIRILTVYVVSIVFRLLANLAAGWQFPKTAQVIAFLVLVLQGIAVLNLGAIVLFSIVLRALHLEPPKILRDLAIAFSYIVLVFVLFSQYKVDVSGIIATSAVLTAVIGFSLQDTLANVMGGVAMQVDRSVAPGDWIRFGEVSGIVREISWRCVTIESRNGDRYMVPNGLMMKNPVMLQGKRWAGLVQERRWVYFHVDLRETPTVVIDAVTEALNREPIERVAADPRPNVILMEYGDSSSKYAVRYWLTDLAVDDWVDSLIRTRIYFALRRIGVPFSIPSTNFFLHRGGPPSFEPAVEKRIADLKHVSIFASLTSEELQQLAEGLIYAPFLPGEAILIQGAAVHHLYILTRGRAEVRLSVEGAPPTVVAILEAPDFFGERGMLTGEPRRATIIALTEVECWRLEKRQFEAILRARPEMTDEISHVLAKRNLELGEVQDDLSEEARRIALSREHKSMRARINKFFGLQ